MAITARSTPNTANVPTIDQGTVAPVATDLPTAIALANDLRQIMLNLGLVRA